MRFFFQNFVGQILGESHQDKKEHPKSKLKEMKVEFPKQSTYCTVQNNTQNRTRGHALIHKLNQQVPHCVRHHTQIQFPNRAGSDGERRSYVGLCPDSYMQLSSLLWPSIHTHMLQLALLLLFGPVPGPNTTTASSTPRV